MSKWYVGRRDAEGSAIFFVELTSDELEAVIKFTEAQGNGPDEGYSGSFTILDAYPFDSLEDAKAWARRETLVYSEEKDWD